MEVNPRPEWAGGGEQRARRAIDTLSDLLITESRDASSFMLWSLDMGFSVGWTERWKGRWRVAKGGREKGLDHVTSLLAYDFLNSVLSDGIPCPSRCHHASEEVLAEVPAPAAEGPGLHLQGASRVVL